MRVAFALIVGLALIGTPASASTYTKVKMKCAVGGERFTATVQMSMSSFGQRPDGKLYSTGIAPPVECPGNGLIHYKDEFSKDEVARLTPLVGSEEYQALRRTETADYRVYWLLEKMGAPPDEVAAALLAATWSSDDRPESKVRYQRLYIETVGRFPWSEEKRDDWFWYNLRAANALRELGEFTQSSALLETLNRADRLPNEADALQGARVLIGGLRRLNADQNAAMEPANLIPHMEAAFRCSGGKPPPLSPAETEACAKSEVREAIELLKQSE